jgi:hypothetical protein
MASKKQSPISTMSMKGPDGKEMTVMRITYTRQR